LDDQAVRDDTSACVAAYIPCDAYRYATLSKVRRALHILDKTKALWTGSAKDVKEIRHLIKQHSRHCPKISSMLRALTEPYIDMAITKGELIKLKDGEVLELPPLPNGRHYGEDHLCIVIEGTLRVNTPTRSLVRGERSLEIDGGSFVPWYCLPPAPGGVAPWCRRGREGTQITLNIGAIFGAGSFDAWDANFDELSIHAASSDSKEPVQVFMVPCEAWMQVATLQVLPVNLACTTMTPTLIVGKGAASGMLWWYR